MNLAHLNALPGELLRECLPARSCRLDDHQDATLKPGKLPEEPVDAIARMSEPEPPIGPIRCAQHRFVRRAAPQIDADCPRGLARVDSRSHVRHPLHPASSDSGLSPHTPGPMSYSKRRLTYVTAATSEPQLPRQPNCLRTRHAPGSYAPVRGLRCSLWGLALDGVNRSLQR